MVAKRMAVGLLLAVLVAGSVGAIGVSFGARISAGHAFFYGADYDDDLDVLEAERDFRFGLEVGGFMELSLTGVFAVQPEIVYVRGGGDFSGETEVGTYSVEESFNYIGVPVLLKAGFPTRTGRVFFFAGPCAKFLVGDASAEIKEAGASIGGDYDEAFVSPYVISGVGGVGYEIPLGLNWLFFEARTNIDFTSVFDPDETDNYDQRGASVLLGAGFGVLL